jgi:hypothetical protein
MVRPRDDQDVHRRLRIDIAERHRPRRGGNYGRRYVARGDAAEQAVRHGEDLNV